MKTRSYRCTVCGRAAEIRLKGSYEEPDAQLCKRCFNFPLFQTKGKPGLFYYIPSRTEELKSTRNMKREE